METLGFTIIAIYGLAMIVTQSRLWPFYEFRKLFEGVPVIGYLLHCPSCSATWIGLLIYYILPGYITLPLFLWLPFIYGTIWIIGRFLGDID